MRNVSIDIETYSDVELKKCGVYKYVQSPNFEILLFGYSVDEEAVQVIDLAQGETIPDEIIDVNNARTHSAEQVMKLRSSLREFGFINPVIIDREYNVIAGHGRILAAKEEGITEVPCVFVDYLTETQKKAYILADNRMAMDAGWDEELLRIEIESLKDMDFNVGLTGFSEDELAELYGEDKQSEVEDDDYDLSDALEKAAFVQRGDIWTVGRHRLMCGDATSSEDVAALMNGKKANLIITDPPYNVAFESSDGLSIKNDKMANDKFYEFLLSAFKNMAEHLEKGGSAYVFHADTEGLNFRKAFVDAGFHLSGCCIWVKNSLVLGRSDYQWQHAYKLHVAIKVTEELLYDNAFGLENYIITQFGKALANAEEDAFLNGDGKGKPTGIFDKTKGGQIAGILTAAIKSDDLIDLVYGLKRPYRKSASFIMNDATLASLRKLKDNNGAYIWQPSYKEGEPDRVLGYTVHTSSFAPTNAIAFGDYSYYNIGDRGSRSFGELRELFAGNGMIGFLAKERVDGKLVLPEAVKVLKLKEDTASTGKA